MKNKWIILSALLVGSQSAFAADADSLLDYVFHDATLVISTLLIMLAIYAIIRAYSAAVTNMENEIKEKHNL